MEDIPLIVLVGEDVAKFRKLRSPLPSKINFGSKEEAFPPPFSIFFSKAVREMERWERGPTNIGTTRGYTIGDDTW